MNIKRTIYSVGDMYRHKSGTYWVLTKIVPARAGSVYVLSRNGVHCPLTSEELEKDYTLHSEGC